jgi:hypothetical protein
MKNRREFYLVWSSWSVMGNCGDETYDADCHRTMSIFDAHLRHLTSAYGTAWVLGEIYPIKTWEQAREGYDAHEAWRASPEGRRMEEMLRSL